MNRAAPEPKQNMGKPAPRIDGRLKVIGEARYGSDFAVGNPAYGFLVTSTIAKGRIEHLDLTNAKTVPGVLEIFTFENTGELKNLKYQKGGGGPTSSMQDFGPQIHFNGQIIALVVADTFEDAREAARKVRVTYQSQAPSATFDQGDVTEEKVKTELPQAGDAEAAFNAAEIKLDVNYATPPQHHNPIELFTTTCAWRDGRLTIYEPSQFVHGLKANAADKLGVALEDVHVVNPYVGGAFGSKGQFSPRTGIVALAAKRLNRPVKLVATRDQGFTIQTYRAETKHRIRMGASRDGKIASFMHDGWEVTSRPDPYAVAGVEDSARLYGFGAVKTNVTMVHADRNTPGFMRSPPVVPYIFALESAMDELAVQLKMDPVELRRVNDSEVDATGKRWSSRSLMTCYDQAAERFGWKHRRPDVGAMRDGDWLIGWGCASAVYPTHVGAAAARVRLLANGKATVQIAAHDLGTGAYTVIGQIAAEHLGIPLNAVTVELGDSDLPPAPVAGGSNTTASACSAVMKACDSIRARLVNSTGAESSEASNAKNSGATVGQVDGGSARGTANAPTDLPKPNLDEAFKRLGVGAIEDYAEFLPPGAKPDAIGKTYAGTPTLGGGSHGEMLMYATGAEFVEVRVHALTREIRVPRIVGAFAAGRIMNTRTARSQYMGAMIWGISSALHEASEIDPRNARYVNNNLADYMIPVNADIQDLDVILVPETDDHVNPVGVKGIGELGNVGTAAAIANAVYHATGVRVRELPIRLEKLLGV
jgi:xanthine dehydrogenase YagR molybdenum-binding subunit